MPGRHPARAKGRTVVGWMGWALRSVTRHSGRCRDLGGAVTDKTAPRSFDLEFSDFYRDQHRGVFSSLFVVTGDHSVAAEATDEAFARAVSRWDRVSAMSSPGGWVYRVALNAARRIHRRRSLEERILRRTPLADRHVEHDVVEVWEVLRQLPSKQRATVALKALGDLTEHEIAEVLGVSRSTVSSNLADARRRLAPQLRPNDPEGDSDGRPRRVRATAPRD